MPDSVRFSGEDSEAMVSGCVCVWLIRAGKESWFGWGESRWFRGALFGGKWIVGDTGNERAGCERGRVGGPELGPRSVVLGGG